MKFSAILSALCVAASASAYGVSPVQTDSPTGVTYKATFTEKIDGYVQFSSKNGSLTVDVDISGLPDSGGPFLYHVHKFRVPANGSCLATGSHFNPYGGNENATVADQKEAGDLLGKHGLIDGTSISTSYIEEYLSLNPESEAFFANLSVVVHFHNTTRLACANIDKVASVEESGAGAMGAKLGLAAGAAALAVLI